MDLKLEYNPLTEWRKEVSCEKPEIVCISRPYVNQVLLRNSNLRDLIEENYDDHHHGHGVSNIDAEISEGDNIDSDSFFRIKPSLRYRQENNGQLLAQMHSVYFVNTKGMGLVEKAREETNLDRLESSYQELGISKDAGDDFLKKLIAFNLIEWTQ